MKKTFIIIGLMIFSTPALFGQKPDHKNLLPCKKMNAIITTRSVEENLNQQMTLAELLEQLEKINLDLEKVRDLDRSDVDEIGKVLLKKKEYLVAQLQSIESITHKQYFEEPQPLLNILTIFGYTAATISIPVLVILMCYEPESNNLQAPSFERLLKNFTTLKNRAFKE